MKGLTKSLMRAMFLKEDTEIKGILVPNLGLSLSNNTDAAIAELKRGPGRRGGRRGRRGTRAARLADFVARRRRVGGCRARFHR
jgi:hypothetical protein